MPQFRAEIPEIHTRIVRPVLSQILNDILKMYKDIPFKEFRFLGDSDALLTPGSELNSVKFNRSTNDNYVDVEVDDLPDDEYNRSFQGNQNTPYIFRCTKTKVDFYPVYQNRKLTINFKVVCNSRVKLAGLITRMSECMRQSQTLFTHLISYNYDLPAPCILLIKNIFKMMSDKFPYEGLTLDQWLKDSCVSNLTLATRQNGDGRMLIYQENAVNVLSNLTDFDSELKRTKESNTGVWSTEFSIETRYQQPSSIRASYPLVIHNQFLDDIWFNKAKLFDYNQYAVSASMLGKAMERWKWTHRWGIPGRGNTGCQEPGFDDWGVEYSNVNIVKLVTCLVVVDESNLKNFFNIVTDLNEYKFPDEMIPILKTKPESMLYTGRHFFDIRAYCWGDMIRPEHLSFDDNLNISVDYDLNPRNYYHIIISLNGDPTTIDSDIWDNVLCDESSLVTYFSLFGDAYGQKITDLFNSARYDENDTDVCITKDAINSVITDMINDGADFENSKIYSDPYSIRTKLNYAVLGNKGD